MISCITLAGRAAVMAGISWLARRETPQSVRGQEAPRANIHNRLLLLGRERAYRQGHGKNLVRPERRIVSDARRIDNVEAAVAARVPESLKAFLRFGHKFFVSL